MHQVKGWSMTSDLETFLKGATYYRNGRDWAKERRDEAIRRANERVDEHHVGTLAIDAGITPASSFVSEATLDGTSTIEALSQESRIPQTEDSNTTTHQESETSSIELSVERRAPVKRSNKQPRRSPQSRRKRLNAGDSDYDLFRESELQPSEPSGVSQQFEKQVLRQEPQSRSSRDDLQQISLGRSMEKPTSNKKKA